MSEVHTIALEFRDSRFEWEKLCPGWFEARTDDISVKNRYVYVKWLYHHEEYGDYGVEEAAKTVLEEVGQLERTVSVRIDTEENKGFSEHHTRGEGIVAKIARAVGGNAIRTDWFELDLEDEDPRNFFRENIGFKLGYWDGEGLRR